MRKVRAISFNLAIALQLIISMKKTFLWQESRGRLTGVGRLQLDRVLERLVAVTSSGLTQLSQAMARCSGAARQTTRR